MYLLNKQERKRKEKMWSWGSIQTFKKRNYFSAFLIRCIQNRGNYFGRAKTWIKSKLNQENKLLLMWHRFVENIILTGEKPLAVILVLHDVHFCFLELRQYQVSIGKSILGKHRHYLTGKFLVLLFTSRQNKIHYVRVYGQVWEDSWKFDWRSYIFCHG